jgi:murein tripeptide amidase MpaA
VSARVHPGEVASSHILNGFIKFLFSKVHEAQTLLNHFVFYIVPIVNPDGVIDGNFRTDSRGNNLNRFYTNPSQLEQPEIYNIKKFILQMIGQGKI